MAAKSTIGMSVADNESVGKEAEKTARRTKRASLDALKQLRDLERQVTSSQKSVEAYLKGISLYSKEVGGDLKALSKAMDDYRKQTKETIDKIKDTQEEMASEQDEKKKQELAEELGKLTMELGKIQQAYTKESKLHQQHIRDVEAVNRHYAKLRDQIEQLSEKDMEKLSKIGKGLNEALTKTLTGEFKGVGSVVGQGIKQSLLKGSWQKNIPGFGKIGGAKALQSQIAEQEAKAAAAGPNTAGYAAAAQEIKALTEAMGKTTMAIGMLSGGFLLLLELFKKVDGQAAKYNQTISKGIPLAGELMKAGVDGVKTYTDGLTTIRNQIIRDNTTLFDTLNINGEEAASIMNDYISKTTNSITKAVRAFQGMSDPDKAVFQITKSVVTYGRMMGVSTEEVTSMMGDLHQELGSDFNQVNHIMDSVVSAALSSGVPVNKFVGMFKDMLPTIDLFNNRLDETVGVMKQLGKAMSPEKLRSAMQALTKGFSGRSVLDMTQLSLKAGTGVSTQTADTVIADRMASLSQDIGLDLKKMFAGAKTPEEVGTKTAEIQSMMQALGKSPAQIEMVRQLGRMVTAQKKYQSGNQAAIMDVASVLKEGGGISATMAIYSAIQKRFNLGSMTGLDEHVFDTLTGVSEDEKKAIMQLQSVLKQNMTEMNEFGQLADKGLQLALQDVVQEVAGAPGGEPVDIKEYFKKLTDEQKGDLILRAMRRQETKDSLRSDREKQAKKSAEDLQMEHINATRTVSDYLNGVLTSLLEKFLNSLAFVAETLRRWFGLAMKSSVTSSDKAISRLTDWSTSSTLTGDALQSYTQMNRELMTALRDGKSVESVSSMKGITDFFKQGSLKPADTATLVDSVRTMQEFSSLNAEQQDSLAASINKLSTTTGPEALKEVMAKSNELELAPGAQALLLSMIGSRVIPNTKEQFKATAQKEVKPEDAKFDMDEEIQRKLIEKSGQFTLSGSAETAGKPPAARVPVAPSAGKDVLTIGDPIVIRHTDDQEADLAAHRQSGPRTSRPLVQSKVAEQDASSVGGWGWLKSIMNYPGLLGDRYKEGQEKAKQAREAAAGAGKTQPTPPLGTPLPATTPVSINASVPPGAPKDTVYTIPETTVTAFEDTNSPMSQLADMFKRVTDGGMGMKLHESSVKKLTDAERNSLERSLGNLVRTMAKMEENPEYRKALASDKITGKYSADIGAYANMPMKTFQDWVDKLPQAATGGYVDQTGVAVIHKGENVVPAGKGGNVTVNINMTATTNASSEQIAAAIYNTFRQAQN